MSLQTCLPPLKLSSLSIVYALHPSLPSLQMAPQPTQLMRRLNASNLHTKPLSPKNGPLNYRTISLLPIVSMVMQSIMLVDIKSFIFSPTASSQINNSDSDLVTLPWTCCILSQQCVEDISEAFDSLARRIGKALLSNLFAYVIQSKLHL